MDADAQQRWDDAISKSEAPDCCKLNLGEVEENGKTTVRICLVCGRKHRYMLADVSELLKL